MGTVTNIKVQPMDVTWAGSAMGFLDGDVEVTVEEQTVDVTAHQEGTNVLSSIRTGKSLELALTLKETPSAMVQALFTEGGAASGTSAAGWGSSKDFTHVLSQAGKLVLHPVVNASNNYNEDICAWKAYPMIESFTFSGENPSTIKLTFKVFPDTTRAAGFRLFVVGDHTAIGT
jgi:hypothetical protein